MKFEADGHLTPGNHHMPPGGAVELREDDPRWQCPCEYCQGWRERAAAAKVHLGTGKKYLFE
jgi:hypothetical protein